MSRNNQALRILGVFVVLLEFLYVILGLTIFAAVLSGDVVET